MKCEAALDMVADSLMDKLDDDTHRELRNHLSECGNCADAAEQMRLAWNELGRLKDSVATETTVSALPSGSSWRPLAKAAAILVLLASGALLGRLEVWDRATPEGAAMTPVGRSISHAFDEQCAGRCGSTGHAANASAPSDGMTPRA